MKIRVNKDLILIKGFYFFFNGASAPVAPYLAVIAKSIGYSTTNIGAVLTAVPLLSLVAKPTVGSLADKFSIHKALFLTLMVVSGVCMFSLQWFAYAPVDTSVLVDCEAGSRVVTIWQRDKLSDKCYKDRVISAINNSSMKCEINCYSRLRFDNSSSFMEKPPPPYVVELIFSKFQFQAIVLNITSVVDLYGEEKITSCSETGAVSCDLSCSNPEIQKLIIRPAIGENDAPRHAQFWIFAILGVTWRTAVNNAYTFGDTICLNLLKDRPQDFGTQKTFGAAGWGLIGLLGGIMTDWYSQGKHTPDYTLGFYLALVLNFICIFIALNLKYEREKKTSTILSDVRSAVLGNPQFILFLLVIVFCGVYSGLVWNFLLWFVEDIYSSGDQCEDGRWIKTLEGLIIFVHTWVGEIGFFAVSGWMVKRFGPANCISLVLFAFSLRFTLFYFIPNPWWLLAIEVLNGITYATYCVTAASYANQVAPAGTRATVQGITSGVFDVGLCMGIFFGGVFIDRWGGRLTFLSAGISAFILGIIYTGLRFCLYNATPTKNPDPVSNSINNASS